MKRLALSISLLTFAALATATWAKEDKKTAVQLTVDLTDSSRVIGTTTLPSLPVRSEALGKLEIPFAKIRTIKFSKDHESVAITLNNGDSVKGGLGEVSLKLQTVVGMVSVPVEHITTIGVAEPLTGRTRFSAAEDFSAESNPAGPWSYGQCNQPQTKFQLYTQKGVDDAVLDIKFWGVKTHGPAVVAYTGKQTVHVANNSVAFKAGQLSFHPGPRGEHSVIRWTAPRAGRFQIAGAFTGLSGHNGWSPTTTDVHVLHNDQSLFDSFINVQGRGNEATFDLKQDVKVGDTIDFVVGFGNGSHSCDTTGLEAVITLDAATKSEQP